jgi:hypothetical protein
MQADRAGSGTIIAFATAADDVAADGDGRNSPYTAALARHLPTPDIPVTEMLNRVGFDVMTATRGDQIPWVNQSPVPLVYLAGAMPVTGPLPQPRPAPVPSRPSPTATIPGTGRPTGPLGLRPAVRTLEVCLRQPNPRIRFAVALRERNVLSGWHQGDRCAIFEGVSPAVSTVFVFAAVQDGQHYRPLDLPGIKMPFNACLSRHGLSGAFGFDALDVLLLRDNGLDSGSVHLSGTTTYALADFTSDPASCALSWEARSFSSVPVGDGNELFISRFRG